MLLEQRRESIFHHPPNLCLGQLPPEGLEYGQAVHDVTHSARSNEQDVHLAAPPLVVGIVLILEMRSLVAWSLGSPTKTVRPP